MNFAERMMAKMGHKEGQGDLQQLKTARAFLRKTKVLRGLCGMAFAVVYMRSTPFLWLHFSNCNLIPPFGRRNASKPILELDC